MQVKNYTDAQTQHLIDTYNAEPTRDTVDALAKEMGKTVKSVIGKLSREKVYQKKVYETKRGGKPITKIEITQEIAKMLGVDAILMEGLSNSSKSDLNHLKDAISGYTNL
jgi:hypothetical protein